MTTLQKYIGVGVVVLLAILAWASFNGGTKFGATAFGQGQVQTDAFLFINGFAGGSTQQFIVDGSGNVTTTGTLTTTGATTLGTTAVGTFTQGGGIDTVATTSTSYTLASTDMDSENVIAVTPGGASLTLTLPASSTLPLGTAAGSYRTIVVQNATTTAGINITMAAGTGETLRTSSSTAIIQSDTSGAKGAILHLVRKANSDILVYMTSFNN